MQLALYLNLHNNLGFHDSFKFRLLLLVDALSQFHRLKLSIIYLSEISELIREMVQSIV